MIDAQSINLSRYAFQMALVTAARLSPAQTHRLNKQASNPCEVRERQWAQSLAEALVGGYFVADDELHQLTDLVAIDNEGYLYFDGIRGDNVGDGITPALQKVPASHYVGQAREFEGRCMHALLAGHTVQQRHLV